MLVTVSIEATVQRASKEACDQFNKPYGTIEILSEGYRVAWAVTPDEGVKIARGLVGSDLTTTVHISE